MYLLEEIEFIYMKVIKIDLLLQNHMNTPDQGVIHLQVPDQGIDIKRKEVEEKLARSSVI